MKILPAETGIFPSLNIKSSGGEVNTMSKWFKISEDTSVQVDKNLQICNFTGPYRSELLNEFRGQPLSLCENEIFEATQEYEEEDNQ
jgi:hypothetical protein